MWYDKLEEKKVWEYFQAISNIPRESGNEEGVRAYLISWAKERNIEVKTDKIGNVIMFKEGAKGKDPICLQGHMDMVCVKREGSTHDFTKDPIEVVLDGNYIRAKDTSLGADNGVAVAFALALLEENDPQMPPLEALFTVCEESKLLGANNVEADLIRSRKLINIDSEEEGIIYIGCAGGLQINVEKKVKLKEIDKDSVHLKLSISGLLGGHSGGEIHKERANANKLLARIMHRFPIYSLTDIQGGTRSNVIPSSAYATFVVDKEDEETIKIIVENITADIKNEYKIQDPGITITLERLEDMPKEAIKNKTSVAFIEAIYLAPNGVQAMSQSVKGVVESSNNIAIISYKDGKLTALSSTRSLVESAKEETALRVGAAFELMGFKVIYNDSYPSWAPNTNSALTNKVVEEYKNYTGKDAVVTCIHAGLECGIINSLVPGMDSVSIGPNLFDVHSVNEHIEYDSAVRTMGFLRHLLKSL
ncbi:MAG: beta-Ala-His dipeptidase [Spirochaetales bacterium]|uniref:beta-Ala-His dipeptidase n=1 Tax=Bullifex sp. TaxID=2815808 RepID=UPI002A5462CE|nr:beta-Ala-His dipeptidase [Bullifex sp.]MDD5973548.1 beta-Ala-His dipeptidase [Spirochaetales bacterium]MDD7272010.1 beta-Ala-His dipeptidase [Spirochaetales bacterium]MDY4067568.1 beta-Ala-His dipeptidase [Bullifex sp.]